MMPLLEMVEVEKSRVSGRTGTTVRIPSFFVQRGEQLVLTGRSGSGKTTLLHLAAGILAADAGSIKLDGCELTELSESRRDTFRARTIGYIFQTFNLLPGLTALENVLLSAMFAGRADGVEERARMLLVRLGLEKLMNRRPGTLSVGEQQRVAVARALVNKPLLLLADEPTASLDSINAGAVVQELVRLCDEHDTALVLVTHDPAVTALFERAVPVADIVHTEERNVP
jgi:putative ABC transport system ATP-binding protein